MGMAKQSDAKRRAKLKDRRRRQEEAAGRVQVPQADAVQWSREYDAEPNVIVELVDSSGFRRAHVEGDGEDWVVAVGDVAAGGSDDVFVALGILLGISLESGIQGLVLQFSPWLIEEVDERCEVQGMDYEQLLRSLLAPSHRALELPSIGPL